MEPFLTSVNLNKSNDNFYLISRSADENRNEIQQQKTELEQMEKDIAELKGQLKDAGNKYQALLKRNQELSDEINVVRSEKERALTRYGVYFTVIHVLILSMLIVLVWCR